MTGYGRTRAVGVTGISGFVVDVEAHVAEGLPRLVMSGRGDGAVSQSAARVSAACASIGRPIASRKITVNLSPASLRKYGSGFDLGICVAILAALDVLPWRLVERAVHLGELGLDGSVRAVTGVLPATVAAAQAGHETVVVPAANAAEARLVEGIEVVPVRHLGDVLERYAVLAEGGHPPQVPVDISRAESAPEPPDLSDVVGQQEARNALEIAAAGGHHVLLSGPPGAGKTMLAERLPGLLPPLGHEDAMEVSAIHSVLGQLSGSELVRHAPFVAPHHSLTEQAMVGGGTSWIRPGAVTQAHMGVLFLDEAGEFETKVLQALRTPLERGEVLISRADGSVRYPSRFQLVLATNPCPCGMAFGKGLECTCTPSMVRRYRSRLSGPLLDRIDLRVDVRPPTIGQILGGTGEEDTETVAARVQEARAAAALRWSHPDSGAGRARLNAHVRGSVLRQGRMRLPRNVTGLLDDAVDRGVLSLRGYDRALRVAWTVADLKGVTVPGPDELGVAMSMRHAARSAA